MAMAAMALAAWSASLREPSYFIPWLHGGYLPGRLCHLAGSA
jgi:hypothetical protein